MKDHLAPSTLQFLNTLQKNNHREWFNDNKELYIHAQADVLSFVENLIQNISLFDEEILKIEPKKALFRIYRDTRFSKDKTPYKNHFGVSLGMGKGKKIAGYYLHIEPGKSFLAGGIYQPDSAILKELRQEISSNGKELLKILENQDFRNNFRGLSTEQKLQRVPSGFDKEDSMAEYLKLKQFVVLHPISDELLLMENASQKIAKIFETIKPLNDFIELPFK